MKYEKPDKVRRAQLTGDTEYLRNAGKKGARVTAEIKAHKKELHAEATLEEKKDLLYRELLAEHGEERAEEIIKELEGRE